jgi:hypothetical protein
LSKVVPRERTTGARKNDSNPCTENPGTSTEANQKQTPFSTNENNPKVRKLMGIETNDSTGLITELTKPIATPARIATGNDAMLTPGKMMSTISRARAVIRVVRRYPIM